MNKKKVYQWCQKYIVADNVRIALLFIPLTYLLVKLCASGKFSLGNYLDVSVLVSFILVFFCEGIAKALSSTIKRKCEDATKLSEDYEKLVKKYCREDMVKHNGSVFPATCQAFRSEREPAFEYKFVHENKLVKYQLPSQIAEHSVELMGAHAYSNVYNNINVRIDDCVMAGGKVKLAYSSTRYYDSLITNRAIDFPLSTGKTIREIYEPGPFLSPLPESRLSNHLGFNGFVELASGEIVFVYRSNKVSIGKNTWGTSVSSSFKAKYGLNADREMTEEGIRETIRGEIRDELKINLSLEDVPGSAVFAFYRDFVEGGKPQFLFYVKLPNLSREAFEENFTKVLREQREKQGVKIDGKKFEYFTRTQLSGFKYNLNGNAVIDGKEYRMVPSAAVSVALLGKFFETGKDVS